MRALSAAFAVSSRPGMHTELSIWKTPNSPVARATVAPPPASNVSRPPIGAVSTRRNALEISSACTSGRHGLPSLFIAILFVVQARPDKLLTTMSKRIRGDAPNAVALRMKVGEKVSSAIGARSRSTITLHSA